MTGRTGKGGWRAIMLVLAVVAVLAALGQSRNPMVAAAGGYAAAVAGAAGGVYLTLRSLNAFLSTAQEVEVGGSMVVSGTAQPFKALEPVDDTIERVAALVFAVMVATGVLSVAMAPAAALGFAMLSLAALAAAIRPTGALRLLAARLGLYGAVLAVALPGAFLAASLLSERMTDSALVRHEAVLAQITADVETDISEREPSDSLWDRMAGLRDGMERYGTLASSIYSRADDLVGSLVGILSVFVFRLLVLPGLILGGVLVAVRALSAALAGR
jgi:disulfide bond formation protein DsbB